jgi:predicted Fe-S protein YdhL (DUF1289 family)
MTQEETVIPSPCIRNCCLNQDNICLGCFRSLTEICGWQQADRQARLSILSLAEERKTLHLRFIKGLMSVKPTMNK